MLPDGRTFESDENGVFLCKTQETLTGVKAIVGTAYTMQIELTTLYIKQADQGGTTFMQNYRLVLQEIEFQYSDSGEFTVCVDYVGKPSRIAKFTGRILGHEENIIGLHPLVTGAFRVPLHNKNTDTRIIIKNSSPLPSSFVGYTWRGNVTYRSRQI